MFDCFFSHNAYSIPAECKVYQGLLEYSNEGTLFVEAGNRADFSKLNTIIYGHNMQNGSMFKMITKYADVAFYEEHPFIYLYTPEKRYEVHLLAGCVVNTESDIYRINDIEQWQTIIEDLQKQSAFTTIEKVEENDNLVTLSTCSYEYENARFVLVGKLVEW